MNSNVSKLLTPRSFLLLFILLGAVLRIPGLWAPLTYDELSALCRLDYGSVAELMTHAVRLGDVHPGGVQLFLWLWCGLFGTAAWVVRLPFLLMGIASIPLMFSVARRWFGPWPALLPAAVVALSQYTIYYSLMARPYASGLFLMLCALLCWTQILLRRDYRWPLLLLFALCEALLAYNHYFSMLSAALLALAGFLYVDRRHLWHYLATLLLAILLFAPHFYITFYQLFEYKGIGGWLGKPTPAFLPDYLRYLAHHSLPTAVVFLAFFLLTFNLEALRRNLKLILLALAVWVLPLVVGYLYSVTVNPLLQFSSLIFVFPFLLLALAGTVDPNPPVGRSSLLLLALAAAMTLSLIFSRHHFQVMQREWIETAAEEASLDMQRYGSDNLTCLFDVALNKLHYYDSTLYSLPRTLLSSPRLLDSALAAAPTDYLLCAGIHDMRLLDVITAHYPYLVRNHLCVSTEVLLFGKHPVPDEPAVQLPTLFIKQFELPPIKGEYYDLLDTTLADIADSRFCCLNTALMFVLPDSCATSLRLVCETYVGRRRVDWHEANAAQFCRRSDSLCTLNLPVRLETPVKHRSQLSRTRVKVYIWDPDGELSRQSSKTTPAPIPCSCRITLFATNPYQYAVLEEL